MNKESQALISGIEFAIDWGLEVPEEDMEEYRYLTAYQQGRVDARREAVKNDICRRRKKLRRLFVRVAGIVFMLLLILATALTKETAMLIVFGPVALMLILKGE